MVKRQKTEARTKNTGYPTPLMIGHQMVTKVSKWGGGAGKVDGKKGTQRVREQRNDQGNRSGGKNWAKHIKPRGVR